MMEINKIFVVKNLLFTYIRKHFFISFIKKNKYKFKSYFKLKFRELIILIMYIFLKIFYLMKMIFFKINILISREFNHLL